jgi:hypothetical protein
LTYMNRLRRRFCRCSKMTVLGKRIDMLPLRTPCTKC